MQSKIPKNS